MSLLADAMTVHAQRLKAAAGETVTYFRGDHKVTLKAVPAETEFEDTASVGEAYTRIKTVDFLIVPSELLINDSRTEPEQADRIVRADDDEFEVKPGPSGTAWEWSDARKTFYRVHTVRRVKG